MRFIEFVRRLNGRLPPAPGRLVHCGRCGSDFVNLVARYAEGERMVQLGWGAPMTRWSICLRCGQCGAVREVEVSDAEAKHFVQEFERGVAEVAAAVARIERDGAEALMAALRDP